MRCFVKYLKESVNETVDWWKKSLESKGIDLVKMSNRLNNTPAWWYWLVHKRLDWCLRMMLLLGYVFVIKNQNLITAE
jgi:hypothetical protein